MDFTTVMALITALKNLKDLKDAIPNYPQQIDELEQYIKHLDTEIHRLRTENLNFKEEKIRSVQETHQIQKQLDSINNWKEEKAGYEIHKFHTGTIVYKKKDDNQAGIFYCPNCFDAKQLVVTLQERKGANGYKGFECNNCRSHYEVNSPQIDDNMTARFGYGQR